jgi:hypothetical protein
LRADLAAWDKLLESDSPQTRDQVRTTLTHWKAERDLAGLRDEAELTKLPERERRAWRALWADVDALLEKAAVSPRAVAPQVGHK